MNTDQPTFQHAGLTFARSQVEAARRDRDQAPFLEAWQFLIERQLVDLDQALLNAFRYVFDDDSAAGSAALAGAAAHLSAGQQADNLIDELGQTVQMAQMLELLRDHPEMRADLFPLLVNRVERLAVDPRSDTLVERLWQHTMRMAAGVVVERADWVAQAAEYFRTTIANEVRPQGFITKAVHGEDGGGMFRQILCAAALVLLAEIGAGVGLDLWRYEVRGVGVSTAAMYPIYYFYTTDKWKWDPGLKPEAVQTLFRRFGGYLEILYYRTRHKDLLALLTDLRPVFSPYVGGLTTLTHGVTEKKRRGLFGW
jgi:hypothetical protein